MPLTTGPLQLVIASPPTTLIINLPSIFTQPFTGSCALHVLFMCYFFCLCSHYPGNSSLCLKLPLSLLFLIHSLHSLFYHCLTPGWIENGAHSVPCVNSGLWSFSMPHLLYSACSANALFSSPLLYISKAPC